MSDLIALLLVFGSGFGFGMVVQYARTESHRAREIEEEARLKRIVREALGTEARS